MSTNNNKTLRSPCRSTCKLNQQDICVGCYRHMKEIAHWNAMEDPARRRALINIQKRRWAKPYSKQHLNNLRPITSEEYRKYR